jgi:hypothetical protein
MKYEKLNTVEVNWEEISNAHGVFCRDTLNEKKSTQFLKPNKILRPISDISWDLNTDF